MECEGCGEAAPALAASGGKSAGGFVVGLLKSSEAVAGKDKLKVRFFCLGKGSGWCHTADADVRCGSGKRKAVAGEMSSSAAEAAAQAAAGTTTTVAITTTYNQKAAAAQLFSSTKYFFPHFV